MVKATKKKKKIRNIIITVTRLLLIRGNLFRVYNINLLDFFLQIVGQIQYTFGRYE